MFCEKCGAKLPEGGRFCESCGAPVAPAANDNAAQVSQPATPPAYPPQPKGPSALATFFANKKNRNIAIAVAAVLVVAIVALIVILTLPKTVVLDNYFTVVYEGYDGYGKAKIEWKDEELKALNKEIFAKGKKASGNLMEDLEGALSSQLSLKYFVNLTLNQEKGSLSNGDTVTISHEIFEGFEEKYDLKIKLNKDSYTVEGLSPVITVDVMSGVSFAFEGFDGNGDLVIHVPEEPVSILGSQYTMEYRSEWNGIAVGLCDGEGYRVDTVYYRFDRCEELSNGETLMLTQDSYTSNFVEYYGLTFPETAATVTVKDLKPLQSFDPFSHLSFSASGYNTIGILDGTAPADPIALGDYSVVIEKLDSDYRLRFRVDIVDGDGNVAYDFNITADKFRELSNGEVVTFSASYYDVEYITRQFGIIITMPEEPSITVSGLTEALDPKLFDHLTVSFRGYEGYGVMEATLTEDVFTVGNYTFKLTYSADYESWWSHYAKLTVVVADLNGTNLFSVEYTTYDVDSLQANGETIAFRCGTSSSGREEILTTYGIALPEEVVYTIAGLAPVTVVDPREKLTYSFAGENGSIVLTMTLNETSYIVGNYTVNLEVVEEESWWSTYLRLKFTIVDNATQAEVGSGDYTVSSYTGLYEGGTIYLNDNFDRDAIAMATGLLFSNESPDIIVSTK